MKNKRILIMFSIIFGIMAQHQLYCDGELISIESFNYPGMFIGFYTYEASLFDNYKEKNKEYTTFRVAPGLANFSNISFKFPLAENYYLRHQDGQIRLTVFEDEQLFKSDATFIKVPGLAHPENPDLVSFQAYNLPDMYIRIRDSKLYLELNDESVSFKESATFRILPPNWDGLNPKAKMHELTRPMLEPREATNFSMLLVLGVLAIALSLFATRLRDKKK
jgi:hypothetical protein